MNEHDALMRLYREITDLQACLSQYENGMAIDHERPGATYPPVGRIVWLRFAYKNDGIVLGHVDEDGEFFPQGDTLVRTFDDGQYVCNPTHFARDAKPDRWWPIPNPTAYQWETKTNETPQAKSD